MSPNYNLSEYKFAFILNKHSIQHSFSDFYYNYYEKISRIYAEIGKENWSIEVILLKQ